MTFHQTSTSEDEDTLEVIDEEIRRINATFAGLKERRNNLLPLFRLPPELLTDIFYCCLYSLLREYKSPVSSTLASLSRVSRRIRTLTLSCCRLWSLIDLRSHAIAAKMLELAGSVPLVIRVQLANSHSFQHSEHSRAPLSQLLKPVMENVQRFRELHIRASQRELAKLYETMDKFQPTTIPLVSLRIECTTDDMLPLSQFLINCTAPELSEARIYGAQMPLDSPLLGNALGHLELCGNERGSGTLKTTLDGLRNLPNLHTLILRNHLLVSPQKRGPLRKLHLPKLAFFALEDSITHCAQLLELVEAHYPTRVDLTCRGDVEQEPLLHPFLASFSRDGEQEWIRALSLKGYSSGYVELVQAWPIEPPQHSDTIGKGMLEHPSLSVKFMCIYPEDVDDIKAAGVLCSRMRLNNVRTLTTYDCDGWSAAAWRRAFQQCTDVKNLVVNGLDFSTFIAALSVGVDVDEQHMMKNLECIAVHYMFVGGENYLENLRDMLTDRCYYDLPLQELRLVECPGLTERDHILLEGLVPKLDIVKTLHYN